MENIQSTNLASVSEWQGNIIGSMLSGIKDIRLSHIQNGTFTILANRDIVVQSNIEIVQCPYTLQRVVVCQVIKFHNFKVLTLSCGHVVAVPTLLNFKTSATEVDSSIQECNCSQ